ncbi:MAG: NmrA family transcriptional regulator, partial [Pseudomonadota bacterium]
MPDQPILVIGSTGKTGTRVTARLEAMNIEVRRGTRRADIPFDWEDDRTWTPVLTGVSKAYVT